MAIEFAKRRDEYGIAIKINKALFLVFGTQALLWRFFFPTKSYGTAAFDPIAELTPL